VHIYTPRLQALVLTRAPCLCSGQYNAQAGTGACENCGAGRFHLVAAAVVGARPEDPPTQCALCPAAKYQNLGGQPVCASCPAGKYINAQGNTACGNCEVGKIADPSGRSSCAVCLSGKFQDTPGLTVCTVCPIGKYADNTDSLAASAAACEDCPPGRFFALTGATALTDCEACPAGQFQEAAGQNFCNACPAGKFGR
jgi:hypothetical protein